MDGGELGTTAQVLAGIVIAGGFEVRQAARELKDRPVKPVEAIPAAISLAGFVGSTFGLGLSMFTIVLRGSSNALLDSAFLTAAVVGIIGIIAMPVMTVARAVPRYTSPRFLIPFSLLCAATVIYVIVGGFILG